MEIPPEFHGFRLALGDTVEDNHFVARSIRREPDYARWLDARYFRVFSNKRFEATEERLARLRQDLARIDGFDAADAEVQTAATILRVDGAQVQGRTEGGARAADYVVSLEQPFDVEVRVLQEDQTELEIEGRLESIRRRLEAADLGPDLWLMLQVRRVRDDTGRHVFSDGVAKKLVAAVRSAVRDEPWRTQDVSITVRHDGMIERVSRNRTRYRELASVALRHHRGSPRTLVVASPLTTVCTEADRVYAALKDKGSRKQRAGQRPWVIVLNSTNSMLLERAELVRGARRRFDDTKGSLSAVAIQHRALSLDILSASLTQSARFTSFVIPNKQARFPLTDDELQLFREQESRVVQQRGS